MKINKSEFIKSVYSSQDFLSDKKPHFAFVGRSNVGKSSLINSITNRKNLAKTSSTPGKTRAVNYFNINDELFFVDLPGYGYHKASKSAQKQWAPLIEEYLLENDNMKALFVLLDIRHKPTNLDKQMIDFLYKCNITFYILATKSDKISKSQINKHLNMISSDLGVGSGNIIVTSSKSKTGLDKIYEKIEALI